MYLDDCVCVLPDLTWLPLLGVGRKSWYIIHIIYTALLKSDISSHFKDYSSPSFQPTGIGLGSLWRGNRCAYWNITVNLKMYKKNFLQICKVVYLATKKNTHISKNSIKFTYFWVVFWTVMAVQRPSQRLHRIRLFFPPT